MPQENNQHPVTDKALNRLLVGSVLSILACLIALCSTTFCWFTDTVKQEPSYIQAASQCLLSITVVDGENVPLSDIEEGVTLSAGVTYQVTLILPKDSSSGYCQMQIGDRIYRSEYIPRHDEDTPKTLTYLVKASEDAEVKFLVHWGLYSADADVLANELLEI